ncbi:CU044_5270 family protein [Streptomyces sp. NPDC021224]|uniref:CU044_5270 family protein n=1 Tax=unclassified Streptomyces TaxID=2593676 RepID=UPI00379E217B
MDDLRALQELAADPPPLTAAARAAARERLQEAVEGESRAGAGAFLRATTRRTAFRLAVAATVAAAVAGTAVVTSGGGSSPGSPGTSRMANVSAAQVLHQAAGRTLAGAPLPIPRDDQYFYVRTRTTHTPVGGGKTRAWTDESWLSVDGSRPSRRQELGTVHNDPPLEKNQVVTPPTQYAALQKWPTDPATLFTWLGGDQDNSAVTAVNGGAQAALDPGREVYTQACLLIKGPRVMPPGLQAATFEVLAKLPKIRIDDDGVDALGRHGIAVSYPGTSFSVVFDRTTYDYLGLRQTGTTPKRVKGEWVDGDKYTEMTAQVEVGVVDSIGRRP